MTLLKSVSSVTRVDSGRYYTSAPSIEFIGGFAEVDSSKQIKFGDNSLDMHQHSYTFPVDSVDTSMNGFLAFWLWVDSAGLPDSAGSNMKPLWEMGVYANGAFRRRFGVDHLGRIASTNKYVNANNITTWENQSGLNNDSDRIIENQWNHVIFGFAGADQGFATRRAEVMINGTRVYYTNSTGFSGFFHDSGILFGAQLSGPYGIGSVVFDSPSGMYMDNLYLDSGDASFTLSTEKTALFTNDSANGNWFSSSLAKFQPFDNDSAEATCTIDSFGGVDTITITDSGFNYVTAPTVKFTGGHVVDSDFAIGDTVEQTLTSGVKVSGEIQRVTLDSAGDSCQIIHLAHVGADDGKYHSFQVNTNILPPFTTGTLINKTNNTINGLIIERVTEDNKMSETEQNDTFSTISDDFLDFTENNPFGDPENQ